MQTSKIFSSMTLCGGLLLGTGNVFANSIEAPDGFVLDEELGYTLDETFTGEFYSYTTFEVTQAGVYELVLTDSIAPSNARTAGEDLSETALRRLQARVTTHDEKIASLSGSGSALFELQPGTHYLKVFAQTATPDANSEFGLALQQVDGNIPAVPLPATLWLLGSGLMGLVGVARRKN